MGDYMLRAGNSIVPYNTNEQGLNTREDACLWVSRVFPVLTTESCEFDLSGFWGGPTA